MMRSGDTFKVKPADRVRALWFTGVGQAVEGYLTEGEYRVGSRNVLEGHGEGVSLIGRGEGHIYYVAEASLPGGLADGPPNPGADPVQTVSALDGFARADLALARNRGEVLVAQTKRGTLRLEHRDGVYTLTTIGLSSVVLATGRPRVVVPVLVSMYDVGA